MFVENEAKHTQGNGGNRQQPQHHVIVLQLFIAAETHTKTLRHNLHPIAEEIEHDGQQGADMQGDIEIERLGLPPQQPRSEVQVRGAADRQEFRKSLNDGQNYHLQERHKVSA